jgi:hypothetical protein
MILALVFEGNIGIAAGKKRLQCTSSKGLLGSQSRCGECEVRETCSPTWIHSFVSQFLVQVLLTEAFSHDHKVQQFEFKPC